MDEKEARVLDAAQATAWLWKTCENLDKLQAAGFLQTKDIIPNECFEAWVSEKQVRSMVERAERRRQELNLRRRDVLEKLTEDERLAIGYPQRLGKNPNYPIYHVAEKEDRSQTTATP